MFDLCLVMLPNPALFNPLMYYNIGILYLAAAVEKAGWTVCVQDMRGGYKSFPEARYYGFSATTPEIALAKKLAQQVSGKTIIGGAHATLMPQDCIAHFDYTVIGEGEKAILNILKGKTSYRVVVGERIGNLDELPFPAWDQIENPFSDTLFPGERYGRGEKAASIIASRGCPFKCSFCANLYNAPVVYRSSPNICAEIKALKEREIGYFRFEDDNVTIHPDFDSLMASLKNVKIHYKCHTRSDLLTTSKAQKLKESGCEECGLGIESADDSVLKLNNKKETVADHKQAIQILKDAGIRVKTYWVMGLPGETDRTLELNEEFVAETQPDKWTISTFTPYPGSPIFSHPENYNIKIIDWDFNHWWNFVEETNRYNHIINGQTLDEMWIRYKRFYHWIGAKQWQSKPI